MSQLVDFSRRYRYLTPVEIEQKFGLARGDVESVTSSPSGIIIAFRDGITPPIAGQAETDGHIFANLTVAQAAQWIETNVTTLATAKVALKRLAEFCIYLRDRG